jgi:hypothetical protein
MPDAGVPRRGAVKVGPFVPANEPVPLCPERLVFTALIVAMFNPLNEG